MQALDEYEQLVLAGLYGAGTPGVGGIEQEIPKLDSAEVPSTCLCNLN
jgi:hypothetical protein